jgi:hypothetical protein
MLPNAVRAGLFCALAGCLLLTQGCGVLCYSNQCRTIYDPDCRACYGIPYEGRCTCRDEIRDRINQVSDIFLP